MGRTQLHVPYVCECTHMGHTHTHSHAQTQTQRQTNRLIRSINWSHSLGSNVNFVTQTQHCYTPSVPRLATLLNHNSYGSIVLVSREQREYLGFKSNRVRFPSWVGAQSTRSLHPWDMLGHVLKHQWASISALPYNTPFIRRVLALDRLWLL